MKDGKFGWGIVGCGVIAPWHRGSVEHCPEAQVTAVCDIDEDKGRKFAAESGEAVAFYKDYHDLVADKNVDILSVCTPSGAHGEVAIAAAQAGKHVLCEKPLEITLQKMDEMIGACRDRGVKLGCIFQRRTYESSKQVRAAIQRGELGKMVLGDAFLKYYRSQAYYNSAGWRGTWEWDGGGALMNQGVHGIDLLLWIMGDVESVYARTDHLVRDIAVEDTAVALLRYKNGAWGVVEGTTSVNPESRPASSYTASWAASSCRKATSPNGQPRQATMTLPSQERSSSPLAKRKARSPIPPPSAWAATLPW